MKLEIGRGRTTACCFSEGLSCMYAGLVLYMKFTSLRNDCRPETSVDVAAFVIATTFSASGWSPALLST